MSQSNGGDDNNSNKTELNQNELTQNDRTKNQGFFKLSHGVFSDPRLRALTGDAFRIYLFMCSQAWRFPESNGILRAAAAYISKGTGISTATVSRCLGKLLEANLIRLEKVDHKWGNTWFVTNYALYKSGESELRQNELTQKEVSQIDKTVESKRSSSPINLTEQLPQCDGQIISINKLKESKNSLSLTSKNSVVERYLADLPFMKREAERNAYEALQKDYKDNAIHKGLVHLLEHGIPPKGDRCHSPLAFMTFGMVDVIAEMEKRELAAKRREESKSAHQAVSIDAREQERRENEEAAKREADFTRVFPTDAEQKAEIAKFAVKFPMLDPAGPNVRRLAIGLWWSSRQTN